MNRGFPPKLFHSTNMLNIGTNPVYSQCGGTCILCTILLLILVGGSFINKKIGFSVF